MTDSIEMVKLRRGTGPANSQPIAQTNFFGPSPAQMVNALTLTTGGRNHGNRSERLPDDHPILAENDVIRFHRRKCRHENHAPKGAAVIHPVPMRAQILA